MSPSGAKTKQSAIFSMLSSWEPLPAPLLLTIHCITNACIAVCPVSKNRLRREQDDGTVKVVLTWNVLLGVRASGEMKKS